MATSIIHLVLVQIFLAFFVNGSVEPWKKSEKTAERGSEVELPCILKSSNCRGLHSIKWYRGTQRIIIFSENAGTTHDNNDIANRTSMDYYANVTQTLLKIKNLKVEDEGLYRCEATYLTINRECNNVQHITLNVTVSPKFVKVIEKDKEAENLTSGVLLGPVNEGTNITLICESDEGKPVPIVEWYKDDQRVTASGSTDIQRNGIGTGRSVLELQVSRNELGATFVCRVSSPALAEPLTVDIGLDVHVGPLKMNVTGVVGHVVSGTKILLECKVSAARPAANVTWCNGTDILSDNNERTDVFETKTSDNSDGTFETSSYFGFTTSEYDNGQTFSCFGENSVTRAEGVKPMKEAITMEILYPPIVSMHPKNITVNETEDVVMFCEYDANPASLKSVKWYRDNQELDLTSDHYEGGLTDQPSLTVKMSNSSDMGTYKCVLTNSVGNSSDDSSIDVSILYKPSVQVIVEPEVPVNEAERLNVSLTCDVTDGNPISLNAVRWYLDGDLLKELPDCARNSTVSTTDDTSTFCDIDPSKLLLEAVGRSFHGNYSCEGRNDAGWGPISGRTSVTVHYKPGPATISYEPMRVVKGNPLNITCSVIDPGRPRITGYKWIRGIHRLTDQEKAVLSMESVNLRTKDNFTCMAYNEAGDGDSATTFIDVSAAPAFIHPLAPYHGYVYNATNVSIGCRVECSPICNVSWSKNNKPIDFSANDSLYYVTNVYHPADKGTSDFESIQSNLTWNLSAWPNGQLDRHKDNDNFTCESNGNGIGPGVRSTTHFQVEYPPENMTVSTLKISVIENTIPDSVKCSAVAHPEPTFRWYREGSPDIAASSSAVLDIKERVPRRSNGTYICEASNRHGPARISVCLDVLYKPDCQINRERINGEDYLVCSAVANPKECNFNWSLKSDNDSIDQLAEMRDGKSYLLLDTTVTNYRTYMCIANNTIDFSSPCELGVPDPGQGVNNNRVDSVSEGLPDSDTKTFYDNLPFHGIQAPQNKPNNLYDYKDHYQQRHEKQKQDILQYGYSLPSSSTGQLTLPLTRSLYPSSLASHLQPSLVHTNSLCQSYSYRQEASSIIDGNGNGSVNDTFPLSMLHGDNHFDIDRTHEHQSQTRQRRNERKKYRKRERKSKHGRSSSSRETSFGKIQELGIPHTYKITHPHYFEDVSACANNQSTSYPKHNSGRDDTINNKLSKEKRAVYTENIRESTRTSPVVGQYAGLNFRDVGQEIDV
ncbi:hemicentin-1 isoform X6 [Diachasmimorpha longicaudata]|uniref:hemicentin-1 isoform X6 n=1 Tax=Diachasmimorpha longicaudata TaxID=58733 RepID=UPI0030B8C33B